MRLAEGVSFVSNTEDNLAPGDGEACGPFCNSFPLWSNRGIAPKLYTPGCEGTFGLRPEERGTASHDSQRDLTRRKARSFCQWHVFYPAWRGPLGIVQQTTRNRRSRTRLSAGSSAHELSARPPDRNRPPTREDHGATLADGGRYRGRVAVRADIRPRRWRRRRRSRLLLPPRSRPPPLRQGSDDGNAAGPRR